MLHPHKIPQTIENSKAKNQDLCKFHMILIIRGDSTCFLIIP